MWTTYFPQTVVCGLNYIVSVARFLFPLLVYVTSISTNGNILLSSFTWIGPASISFLSEHIYSNFNHHTNQFQQPNISILYPLLPIPFTTVDEMHSIKFHWWWWMWEWSWVSKLCLFPKYIIDHMHFTDKANIFCFVFLFNVYIPIANGEYFC